MNTWDDLPSTYSLQEVADVLQSRSEQHASSVLSAMQRDGVKKEVVFAKDLTLRNKVPACGYPFWYFPAGEKLMFQIENNTSIEGGQEAASRTTGSDMTTGNAAKSSVTSFATYRLRYKLHLPIDTLTLRDDMLYYVTWKTGKLRLVNGKADLNTTHMVRNGNNEPVLENQRFFYAFTKKFAEGKAVQRTKERTVRTPEEQVRDLKAFPFASPLKVGMTDPKCVFVSDLRSPSPEFQHPHCDGYIGLLNGLYFSPQHIGYGDHGNTSHVSDAIIQTCHAYLGSVEGRVPNAWVVTEADTYWKSFFELGVPFVCCVKEHKPIEVQLSTGAKLGGHALSVSVHQSGRVCTEASFSFAPLASWCAKL